MLSHTSGVGETTPVPIVRLMLALKLASLAQGHLVCGPRNGRHARGPAEGFDARSPCGSRVQWAHRATWRPLAHMAAAMIGAGGSGSWAARYQPWEQLAEAGLKPLTLGPKEGLAPLEQHLIFDSLRVYAGLFKTENLF